MELGFWALIFGLAVMGVVKLVGPQWMKAAGGLLIAVTVIAIALQVLGVA